MRQCSAPVGWRPQSAGKGAVNVAWAQPRASSGRACHLRSIQLEHLLAAVGGVAGETAGAEVDDKIEVFQR